MFYKSIEDLGLQLSNSEKDTLTRVLDPYKREKYDLNLLFNSA